jgi:hypothetical protein
MEWGRSLGPPLWWFHRWRMKVCCGAQSLAWCRVYVVCYCQFYAMLPKRKVGPAYAVCSCTVNIIVRFVLFF